MHSVCPTPPEPRFYAIFHLAVRLRRAHAWPQIRYVQYFGELLKKTQSSAALALSPPTAATAARQSGGAPAQLPPPPPPPPRLAAPVLRITGIRLRGCPTFDTGGGCDPYVVVFVYSTRHKADFGEREASSSRILPTTQVGICDGLPH